MTVSSADRDEAGAGGGRDLLVTLAASVVALTGAGIVTGMILARAGGGAMSARQMAVVAVAALLTLAAAAIGWRGARRLARSAGTPRDRRNHVVLGLCALLGVAMGIGLILSGDHGRAHPSLFDDGPIAPAAALILALTAGILVPLISLYWHHRVVDEQEAAAYSRGTLLAMSGFWCVAPAWWFLWRGGLAPEPNGILLYMGTIVIAGAVWMHGRYR